MELPKIYNTYFVAIIATVGGMLFGFDISSMSAIIGTDQVRFHTRISSTRIPANRLIYLLSISTTSTTLTV